MSSICTSRRGPCGPVIRDAVARPHRWPLGSRMSPATTGSAPLASSATAASTASRSTVCTRSQQNDPVTVPGGRWTIAAYALACSTRPSKPSRPSQLGVVEHPLEQLGSVERLLAHPGAFDHQRPGHRNVPATPPVPEPARRPSTGMSTDSTPIRSPSAAVRSANSASSGCHESGSSLTSMSGTHASSACKESPLRPSTKRKPPSAVDRATVIVGVRHAAQRGKAEPASETSQDGTCVGDARMLTSDTDG